MLCLGPCWWKGEALPFTVLKLAAATWMEFEESRALFCCRLGVGLLLFLLAENGEHCSVAMVLGDCCAGRLGVLTCTG